MSALPFLLPLLPHPATPCGSVDRLTARVGHDASARAWQLRYTLTGDLARLRIPTPARRPAATDGLWRHTCFEAFVGPADDAAYREYNFSPSGDWAGYLFRSERLRDDAAPALPAPRITCAQDTLAHTLTLDCWLPSEALPDAGIDLLLGLSAVIECADGNLSYWALHHPAPHPDFHPRAGWTARLPASLTA